MRRRRVVPRVIAVVALVAGVATAAQEAAEASPFSVTDPTDDGTVPGTLRWALAQAEGDATPPVVDLAPGLTIDLTCAAGGALAYDHPADLPLVVNGSGATIRQTCAGVAVLAVDDELTLRDATVTGGGAGGIAGQSDVTVERVTIEGNNGGAGITTFTGTTTVRTSNIRNNAGGTGGGIAAVFATVESSTISGNSASNGAGIWSDQTATVTNSTITANTATGNGGGVLTTNSDATFAYATVVGNSAAAGANVIMLTAGDLISFGSVFAAPSGAPNCNLNAGVGTASQGSNADSDGSCGLEALAGDPLLAPLAAQGGPTPTLLPAVNSPLVDAASCAAAPVAVDQRGVSRPQRAACDIGAVEVSASSVPPGGGGPGGGAGNGDAARLPATGAPVTPLLAGAGSLFVVVGVALTCRARARQ